MPTRLALLLLAISLLAACRDKDGARPAAAAPAAPNQEEDAAIAASPGELTSTGQVGFRGASSFFCVPHGEGGLQVDFRTGSADMPAVAVRIDAYHGSGPYPAQVFVTGRSPSGGLVTSPGEVRVEVQQQNPIEGGAPATVSGTFHGQYDGEAGKGSIEGRFASCNYTSRGEGKQPAGAAEETHERPSDASRLSAHPRAGHGGSRHHSTAAGRRGHHTRSPHGSGGPRGGGGRGAGVRGAG
ncbi:MAG TPA: hypothetical protein VIJ02_08010 [Thermoanaerobaculia bacterium]